MTNHSVEIIIHGCGAMAIELAMYIKDVTYHRKTSDKKLVVTDIVSSEFSRADDLQKVLGYSVSLHDSINSVDKFKQKKSIIGIGTALAVRQKRSEINDAGGEFITIIHPSAVVSPVASIGQGVIIAPFVFIGPFSKIGDHSIINVHSTIGHDVSIGSGVIVSPHVNLNGGSSIGEYTFIGAGVVVDPRTNIGRYCKLSSGIVIKKDMPDGMLAFDRESPKSVRMFNSKNGESLLKKR
ncbi:acetyltransferase [Halomonas sp. ISL-60]|uniref:acetyltransferase n=1 Tax=Halomonas sp. ISL-56 TaxID=2819149 RepID=UPI001BE67BC0|nr:acetyltransferase [Halomonas sp. ISL-56]MBT2772449.1 acetyltransferase [Halomonas sp. ISL-60]MBT2803370.1 acetyltransferase [Halomonas sp. ISL-56]